MFYKTFLLGMIQKKYYTKEYYGLFNVLNNLHIWKIKMKINTITTQNLTIELTDEPNKE